MLRQRRIRGRWTAVLVVAVLLMIGCGGGGGDDNGSPATYSISGTVSSDGAPRSGVTVALTGAASASATTDASGNYQFTGLSSGAYIITPPSIPGYGFTPANRQETISADITGVNFDATPNTALAWGRNVDGQLGDGSTTQSSIPVQVLDLTEVVAVSCGWQHTLALRADGTVWAWGLNNSGQLGNGGFVDSAIPVPVSNLINVVAIAAGDFYSLALLSDGTVWGWGDGGNGRLGPSNTGSNVPDPVPNFTLQVPNFSNPTAIACGHRYSLAVRSDGTVWAWGENFYGQLGRNTGGAASPTPEQVMSISDVASIAGGEYHTVAVKSDGTVWAWGLNDNGQLGIGPPPTQSYDALQVTGLSGVVAVAAGSYHSVALGSNGSVWAWGQNFDGQLGDGGTTNRNTPFQVPNLNNIKFIAAGLSHTAAVKSP